MLELNCAYCNKNLNDSINVYIGIDLSVFCCRACGIKHAKEYISKCNTQEYLAEEEKRIYGN
jgi:transcription elongation factor Elf1